MKQKYQLFWYLIQTEEKCSAEPCFLPVSNAHTNKLYFPTTYIIYE